VGREYGQNTLDEILKELIKMVLKEVGQGDRLGRWR
jgi:GGDEF domain-containing protein